MLHSLSDFKHEKTQMSTIEEQNNLEKDQALVAKKVNSIQVNMTTIRDKLKKQHNSLQLGLKEQNDQIERLLKCIEQEQRVKEKQKDQKDMRQSIMPIEEKKYTTHAPNDNFNQINHETFDMSSISKSNQ